VGSGLILAQPTEVRRTASCPPHFDTDGPQYGAQRLFGPPTAFGSNVYRDLDLVGK
jgi:hypothetical protein